MKQGKSQPFILHTIKKRFFLTAFLIVMLAVVGVATALAAPAALTGDLSVNTATVGTTVNQTLTLNGATSGTVSSIKITRPTGWGVPAISSVKFTDAGGSPTILIVSSSTAGQDTTITITSSGGAVTFDNAGDKLEVAFSSTAPSTPAACTAFGVSVSDGTTSAPVTADAGGDCGNELQVRVHHGAAAKFKVDVPASGDFAANVAVVGENRPGIVITAQDSLGNTADGANGGTAYANGVNITTVPSVSASVLITPTAGVGTATIKPTAGGTVKVVATDKTNSAITGQSADVQVAAPVISVSNGNGGAGEKQTVAGTGNWGAKDWTITADSITINGGATTHNPIVLDASGQFTATSVTRAAALPRGSYDVVVTVNDAAGASSKYTKTFAKAFSITPKLVKFARPGSPAPKPTGANNETVTFQGTGFSASVTPSITLVDENGKEFIVTGAVNSTADGDFGGDVNLILPALPEGVYDLRINDGQVNDFDINWTISPNISLVPAISDGLIGDVVNKTTFSGFAFPASLAKGSVSIAIGGASVSGDELLTTDGFGQFNAGATQTLTLTQPLAAGIHDVVITTPTRVDRTFADRYRVASLAGQKFVGGKDVGPGGGTAGEAARFLGDFFLPNHAVSKATIQLGSDVGSKFVLESGTTIGTITVDASGKFTATVTITNGLPEGKRTVRLTDNGGQVFDFPIAYEVVPTLNSIAPARVVRGSTVPVAIAVNVSGMPKSGTVVANTITIGGKATIHDPATITPIGNLIVNVSLQSLPAAGLNDLVIPVQGKATQTFPGAFGVMDVTANPVSGEGAPGTKITFSGVGFLPGKSIAANSISVGGVSTTHSTFKIGSDGSFSNVQVTLDGNLSKGIYAAVVDGSTFDKEYTVGANLTVDPAYADGRTGAEALAHGFVDSSGNITATTTLDGSGFEAGATIAKNSIKVGGKATTHAAVTVAGDGSFSVLLTLPGLDAGDHAVSFDLIGSKGTTPQTSGNIYHVAELTLTPVARTFNQNFMLAGSHLLPNATLQWWSLQFRDTKGNAYPLNLGGVAETDANGVLPPTFVNLSNYVDVLPSGPLALDAMFDMDNTPFTSVHYLFPGIYDSAGEAPLVTVNPSRNDGRAGNTVHLAVERLSPNKTIPSNSITFGGQATQHFAFKTDGNGDYGDSSSFWFPLEVTLPALAPGMHDVVVDSHTEKDAYTVATAKLSPNTGNGNGETRELSGSFFQPGWSYDLSLVGPINGNIWWQGSSVANANGDLADNVSLSFLPTGVYTLTVGGMNFPNAYTVSPAVDSSTGNGDAGNQIGVSGTGFNSAAQIPANSITIDGQTFRGRSVAATATTHDAFQVKTDGSFGTQMITLPALDPGQYSMTIAGQTVNDAFTVIGPVTGTISINNGAASTANRTVTLNLTRSDSVDVVIVSEGNPLVLQDPNPDNWVWYPENNELLIELRAAPGTVTVYARFLNSWTGDMSPIMSDDIVLQGGPNSVQVTASPESIEANGTTTSTISVLVLDVNGNAVANQFVSLETSMGTISSGVTTGADGKASAVLTSGTVAGVAQVFATAEWVTSAVREVIFTAGPPTSVEAKAEKSQLAADGVSNTVVTVTVKDVNGNPVSNQEVALSTTLGSIAPAATVTTNALGQADVVLVAGTQAGTAKVTAQAGAASGSVDVEFITNMRSLFLPHIGR